ncbi:MAG: hypothetical protein RBT62_05325 [Spirochaetia bacterium]|jgi:tetratricopeptide (TPR) repeat protein|nr:hypothetical protein [Spirochaetia bacterium]
MRRFIIAVTVLTVLAVLGSCSNGSDKNLLENMFDIEARSSKNAPPSSVEELKAGIAKYGDQAEKAAIAMEKVGMYWRLLSVKYLEKGLYGDAYDAALKSLRHYPNASGSYYVVGLSSAMLSKVASVTLGADPSRADWLAISENAYKRSIEFDPLNARSQYGLAVLYSFELDDNEAALKPIESFLATDSKNVDGLFVYARILYGLGRLQDSANAYDRIIATTRIDEKKQQAADNKKRILDELYGK